MSACLKLQIDFAYTSDEVQLVSGRHRNSGTSDAAAEATERVGGHLEGLAVPSHARVVENACVLAEFAETILELLVEAYAAAVLVVAVVLVQAHEYRLFYSFFSSTFSSTFLASRLTVPEITTVHQLMRKTQSNPNQTDNHKNVHQH